MNKLATICYNIRILQRFQSISLLVFKYKYRASTGVKLRVRPPPPPRDFSYSRVYANYRFTRIIIYKLN